MHVGWGFSFISKLIFGLALFAIVYVGSETIINKYHERSYIHESALDFSKSMGNVENRFFRKHGITAQIAGNSGHRASVVVAFADEGNSGVSFWLKEQPNFKFRIDQSIRTIVDKEMHGIGTEIAVDGTQSIEIDEFVLGNLRHIRDFEGQSTYPSSIRPEVRVEPKKVSVSRDAGHGHRYELTLLALAGGEFRETDEKIIYSAPSRLKMLLEARSSEKPLVGLSASDCVRDEYWNTISLADRNALSFVAYENKWLAGWWRYATYFGRDSLMSLKLILKAMKPKAIASALAGVLDRVNDKGQASHEETLADYAFYKSGSFQPLQDFKMIDTDFLVADVVLEGLKNMNGDEAKAFLATRSPTGATYHDVIARNLDLVVHEASRFAREPESRNLIHLRDGEIVGQWRDSETGLNGRIPSDVNMALVPAALKAATELYQNPKYGFQDDLKSHRAQNYAEVWSKEVSKYFHVHLNAHRAEMKAKGYLKSLQLKPELEKLSYDLNFFSLALDDDGKPNFVMGSDEGSYLMFGEPTSAELLQISDRVLLPFPYGLMSPVGLLVANPAFASPALQPDFSADHYHGTLVWGREHAVMLYGLLRQLERSDLNEDARQALTKALSTLWNVMESTAAYNQAELWTWEPDQNGMMRYVAYGSKPSHHTVANPIQTWSVAVAILREIVRPDVEKWVGIPARTAAVAP